MTSTEIKGEIEGWTPAPDIIVEQFDLITAAVFGKVWRYCKQELNCCVASKSRMARELGISPRQMQRCLSRLVDAGYFVIEKRPGKPTVYRNTGKWEMKTKTWGGLAAMPESPGSDEPRTQVPRTQDSESRVPRAPRTQSPTTQDSESYKESTKESIKQEREEETTTGPPPSAPADVVDIPEEIQENKLLQELKKKGLSNKAIQQGLRAHGPEYVAQVVEHALVEAADPPAWAAAALRAPEPYTFPDPDRELEAALGLDQSRHTAYLRSSSPPVAPVADMVECDRCHKQVRPERLEDDCAWH